MAQNRTSRVFEPDWEPAGTPPRMFAEDVLFATFDAVSVHCTPGISRAALDVYNEEPSTAGHPLRSAPRTVLTPHLGYVTDDGYRMFYGDAVEDIAAFASGQPVRMLIR